LAWTIPHLSTEDRRVLFPKATTYMTGCKKDWVRTASQACSQPRVPPQSKACCVGCISEDMDLSLSSILALGATDHVRRDARYRIRSTIYTSSTSCRTVPHETRDLCTGGMYRATQFDSLSEGYTIRVWPTKCGGMAIRRTPLANYRTPGIDDALSA
jgi:hypothetical protein